MLPAKKSLLDQVRDRLRFADIFPVAGNKSRWQQELLATKVA